MFLILNIAVILVNIVLFALLVRSKQMTKMNYHFGALLASMTIWILIQTLESIYADSQLALLLVRLDFMLGSIIVLFFFLFSVYFPKNSLNISKKIVTSVYISTLFFFLLATTRLVVENIEHIPGGLSLNEGPLFTLYGGLLVVLAIAGSTILVIKFRRSNGLERSRLLFVTTGLISLAVFVLTFSLILPRLINPLISDYSIFGFVIFIILTFYAVVKYRLLDIKFVLTRSIIYLFLVLIVSLLYVLTSTVAVNYLESIGVSSYILWVLFSIAIVVGIEPLKNIFASISDRVFYKNKINYNQILKELSAIINEEIDFEPLVTNFLHGLRLSFKVSSSDLYLLKKNAYVQFSQLAGEGNSKQEPLTCTQLAKYLKKDQQLLVTEEFDNYVYALQNPDQKKELQLVLNELVAHRIGVSIPVFREGELTAIILTGIKQSGDAYFESDVGILSLLATQFSAALERSKLYQQVNQFNVKLRKEIAIATEDLKDANNSLKNANEKLRELDVAKSEFMSIASHQLRTPLAGVIGYLSMLAEGDYGKMQPNQTQVITEIYQASQRLVRLVNTFLNVTRIEAGRFTMNFTEANMVDLVSAEVKELQPTADKRKIKLIYTAPTEVMMATVDADKIRDVFLNLIDNAIKYTQEGSVSVFVEKSGQDKNNPDKIHFFVKDTGVGIDPHDAENLFQKFVRGSGIARVQPNGSGLGLYIVKKIAEAHNGRVWVSSEGLGKGTTFHAELPMKQPKTNTPI